MAEQQINWERCLQHAEISDIGMRRSNNQDSYAVTLARDQQTWETRGHIFLVADGMGAHAAGELASQLAADNVPHLYLRHADLSAPEALKKAVIDTNAEVHRKGQANFDFHNMGTTCSVLTLLPQGAVAAHIGDSRIYRLRGDKFEQLTFDHSLVWEMKASGQLSDNAELANALPKNVITRSLGPNASVKVDVEGPFPLEIGDTFLLCSDGLTGKITDEELGPILASLPPNEAARVLVDLANLRGGPDNITILIAKVIGPEITTSVAGTKPIRIGVDHSKQRVHPVLWGLLATCFLSLLFFLTQNILVAGVSGVLGLVVLAIILFQMFREPSGIAVDSGQQFGKGPYVSIDCTADSKFVSQLADVIKQLKDAAAEHDWKVDWLKLDEFCKSGAQASESGDHAKAVGDYSRAISFMMAQVRRQRGTDDDEDSVL